MEDKEIKIVGINKEYATKDAIVGHVYETTDYDQFVTFKENREPDHFGNIVSNMIDNGAISNPVKVTLHKDYPGKLVIVDGNNSFHARMQLGLPVPYIVLKDATPKEMSALNLVMKNWKPMDYVNLYAELGYKEYQLVRAFVKSYPHFSFNSIRRILQLNNNNTADTRQDYYKSIERGVFKCTNIKKSHELMKFILDIRDRENGKPVVYKQDKFVQALISIFNFDNFDADLFLQKCEKYPYLLGLQRTQGDYVAMIEEIFNRNNKSTKIHFDLKK